MASARLIAFSAHGPRGLWLRVAAALSLTVFAANAQAQLEQLPPNEFSQVCAPPPAIAVNSVPYPAENTVTNPAAERSFLTPDGWIVPGSPQNELDFTTNSPGVVPAQFQSGLAQLQPGPYPSGASTYGPVPSAGSAAPNIPLENPAEDDWDWRLLPTSLVYSSYWAAPKEPRFSGVHFFNQSNQLIEEGELGARFGLLRYGTPNDTVPQGFQWDVEGAAFPRLLPYETFDMASCDYRVGTDCSYGVGDWRFRCGYYHLSSHVADEYMLRHPDFVRVRYKRETFLWGVSNYPTEWARLYFECGCAFSVAGEGKPLELIFGTDLGTTEPTGFRGAPFAALAVHLRQEVDYGGAFVTQAGWMWRDKPFGHVFRVGFQYLTGYDPQNEFLHDYQQQYGIGVWYDF